MLKGKRIRLYTIRGTDDASLALHGVVIDEDRNGVLLDRENDCPTYFVPWSNIDYVRIEK